MTVESYKRVLDQTDRDIQRGVLAGFSLKRVSLTGYALNPDEDKPTFVFAVGHLLKSPAGALRAPAQWRCRGCSGAACYPPRDF